MQKSESATTSIVRQVVGAGMMPVAMGAGIGLAGVWGLERFVRSLLYGVKPSDPVILAGTLLLLGLAGLVASWLPARKAASVEPLTALRES